MDIRLRAIISVMAGFLPFIHTFWVASEPTYLIISLSLSVLHYIWLLNVDEFQQPLEPFYILLDSMLLNGLVYGCLVGLNLLLS